MLRIKLTSDLTTELISFTALRESHDVKSS